MGTECLLLTHEMSPIDAYVDFADSSKRHCSGIALLLPAGLDFSLVKLVIAIVFMFQSELEEYSHWETHLLATV